MKTVRSIVFWMHLVAGVVAGLVILVMSVTGALLALKPQILTVIESKVRTVTPPPGASRLGPEALLASVKASRSEARPASVTVLADPAASVAVALGRDGTVYVDPYSGAVLGEGSKGAQQFFRSVEDWHRWLAVSGDHRTTARSVTGAANLAFFFLAITGPYLWLPRTWSWSNVRAVLWFRSCTRRPGARFQLAQRDRTLVRADPRHPDDHRRGDVVSVGQRHAVSARRQSAACDERRTWRSWWRAGRTGPTGWWTERPGARRRGTWPGTRRRRTWRTGARHARPGVDTRNRAGPDVEVDHGSAACARRCADDVLDR